jgi:hypothetical protein
LRKLAAIAQALVGSIRVLACCSAEFTYTFLFIDIRVVSVELSDQALYLHAVARDTRHVVRSRTYGLGSKSPIKKKQNVTETS